MAEHDPVGFLAAQISVASASELASAYSCETYESCEKFSTTPAPNSKVELGASSGSALGESLRTVATRYVERFVPGRTVVRVCTNEQVERARPQLVIH
jgi:hypothetical protein